jgi:hypothetical protein
MKTLRESFVLPPLFLAVFISGCAEPQNTQVAAYGSGERLVWVAVKPGPPKWCYHIETTGGRTNLVSGLGGTVPGIPFTNVDVMVSSNVCAIAATNVPSGWTVVPGSHFTLMSARGSSDLNFCLDCPESTNGAVSVSVTLHAYDYTTNFTFTNVSGPRP